jgi:glycerol kinase
MAKFIGAIDQGTTSTRFIIFDEEGIEIARAQKEHAQILPQPGWVEHDPLEIIRNTRDVIAAACRKAKLASRDLAAIGITNQRETVVAWNRRTGEPFGNAIVWQDTRTDSYLRKLKADGLEDMVRHKTGLPLSTYFSAAKMRLLREDLDPTDLCLGTIDTWLIWNLTSGRFVTDVTNASRTSLMDLRSGDWDEELLRIFGIERDCLPEILPSSDAAQYGEVTTIDEIKGVSIGGCLGDQQAALVGQVCFDAGEVKNTYGTGNFMLMNTGENVPVSNAGLLSTACYRWKDQPTVYGLEGSVAVTGSAVQWLRDQLGIISSAAEIEPLAASVSDNGGVYFVPAFSGLFAPYWRSDARGLIVGLSRHSNKAHIARAALEAICFQTRDVLDAMQADTGIEINSLKTDGGATVNDTLMQLQADVLGITVIRPKTIETTSLGAAYAAGLAVGVWKDTRELRSHWQEDRRWEPMWDAEKRAEKFSEWHKAVDRTLNWIEVPEPSV